MVFEQSELGQCADLGSQREDLALHVCDEDALVADESAAIGCKIRGGVRQLWL
jgi:hypothetical protein